MRSGILLLLTMLALLGGPDRGYAQNATVDVGIANTGTQTFHKAVTIGLTPEQIRQMMLDLHQKDSLNAQRATELDQEVERLSAEIGVRKPAVENFLRILGEAQIPVDQLGAKLQEIAQRHLDMLERWSVLEEKDDPAIRQRTDAARTAIDAGEYERADALLAEAEELELEAARQAQALEAQAREAANRHFLAAAANRAKRGELRLTRLDYPGAAKHFKAAAELVPPSDTKDDDGIERRGRYRLQAGRSFWLAGQYARAADLLDDALRDLESVSGDAQVDLGVCLEVLELLLSAPRTTIGPRGSLIERWR
jgi:tetratricopeptide (TPR) repeat protein